MVKKVCGVLSFIVTILAMVSTGGACFFWFYQPKAPKCLSKKR